MPTVEEMRAKVVEHFNQVLGNAYKGLNSTGKRLIQRQSNVSKKNIDKRLKICRSNVCGVYDDTDGGVCKTCKCAVQLAVIVTSKHCPKGLW